MRTKVCQECEQEKRLSLFTLKKDARFVDDPVEKRLDVCRRCAYDGLTADQMHLILREAYRNYLSFERFVADTGKDVIEYTVPKTEETDEMVTVAISFTDLQRALRQYEDGMKKQGTVLSKRKEQAFYLNVVRDMKQKDVAKLMNITTVSVGQYVEQSMLQIAQHYFAETPEKDTNR